MIDVGKAYRPMYDEVRQRPALIRDHLDELDDLVRTTIPRAACQQWGHVLLTGCGDSYYAGLAVDLGFRAWTGLPVEVQPSLHGGRYAIPALRPPAVVFSISHSGRVSRTIETVALARAQGLDTVVITGNPDSPIAHEAHWVLARRLQVGGQTPGVRSYTQAQLFLWLAAIYIGECRGVLDQTQAVTLKNNLRRAGDLLEASLEDTDRLAHDLADEWRGATQFLCVGSGPSYANALFSAAKLVEAVGVNAIGQELEEWAHIQFFLRTPQLPTLLIAPHGRSFDRALELIPVMQGLGCQLAVVGNHDDDIRRPQTSPYFKLHGNIDEALSPLVTSMPAELLACHLAQVCEERLFRADGRGAGVGRGRLTDSQVLREVAGWSPPRSQTMGSV
jgi:glucosamine--fructose-6-phosphate aminotransferase (isomerizing)